MRRVTMALVCATAVTLASSGASAQDDYFGRPLSDAPSAEVEREELTEGVEIMNLDLEVVPADQALARRPISIVLTSETRTDLRYSESRRAIRLGLGETVALRVDKQLVFAVSGTLLGDQIGQVDSRAVATIGGAVSHIALDAKQPVGVEYGLQASATTSSLGQMTQSDSGGADLRLRVTIGSDAETVRGEVRTRGGVRFGTILGYYSDLGAALLVQTSGRRISFAPGVRVSVDGSRSTADPVTTFTAAANLRYTPVLGGPYVALDLAAGTPILNDAAGLVFDAAIFFGFSAFEYP